MIRKIYTSMASLLLMSLPASAQDASICGSTWENSRDERIALRDHVLELQRLGVIPLRQPINGIKAGITLSTTSTIRFEWPMAGADTKYFDIYQSKNFVDMDPAKGDAAILDYMGGNHTYDGHNGMDVGIGPYAWEMQRGREVYAVAAAPGVIVSKRDGGYDINCSWDNPPWQGAGASGNYVALLHDDGHTVSWYKHLKNGTVTNLPLGQKVNTGQVLGVVASSGRSTGPHLHFEVHIDYDAVDNAGTLIEPFYGPQNTSIGQSLWVSQPPYEQPDVLGMEIFKEPEYDVYAWYTSGCDSTVDLSSRRLVLQPGQGFRVRAFIRDWTSGQNLSGFLQDPNGNLFKTWVWANPDVWRSLFKTYEDVLPANATEGIWRFGLSFNNKTYAFYFRVGSSCPSARILSGTHSNNQGYIVSGNISSTATISGSAVNMVQYRADNAVILSPGFLATKGSYFYANNEGCAGNAYH